MDAPVGGWERYCRWLWHDGGTGVSLDVSRIGDLAAHVELLRRPFERAFAAMDGLEAGAVANPDEGRRVGHYWLRSPALAPDPDTTRDVEATLRSVEEFAADVHTGAVAPPGRSRFQHILALGIGGSALGPQLVADALVGAQSPVDTWFLDNTDPHGFDRALAVVGDGLADALVVATSKSGTTPEPRNALAEVAHALESRGLALGPRAVAVTGVGSELHRRAGAEGWLARFPMWDWVGGRTSVWSAVGLVPAALQGIPVRELLAGAAAMDGLTRVHDVRRNPAALLAAAWHLATGGRGEKDMVVLPYKDRLALLARYLQQLVMESLGKERDLDGNVVHQGITVYGNKGSTDQHAFVQQLRDGVPNFFVTFVEVLRDREGPDLEVEPGVTSGDYLSGFLLGTREALTGKGRPSLTITLEDVTPRSLGALLALFERAVGLYASLVHVNAYHQPGVEAGKEAAAELIALGRRLLSVLEESAGALSVEEAAAAAGAAGREEAVHLVLRHLAANRRGLVVDGDPGRPREVRYRLEG